MSLWKRGRQYWTDFTVAGRRYRKRLGTTNLRVATRRERELIEEAGHGRLNDHEQGPHCLSAIDAYLAAKRIRCSPRTIELEEERLSLVTSTSATCRSPQSLRRRSRISSTRGTMPASQTAPSTWTSACCRGCLILGRWRALADHVNLPERQRRSVAH
jgi:hypothetical protein